MKKKKNRIKKAKNEYFKTNNINKMCQDISR